MVSAKAGDGRNVLVLPVSHQSCRFTFAATVNDGDDLLEGAGTPPARLLHHYGQQ
jgi:hypothetical protein